MSKPICRLILLLMIIHMLLSACSISKDAGAAGEIHLPASDHALPADPVYGENLTPDAPIGESIQVVQADLPDFGVAPELTNQVWLNSEKPLRLANLRGRVVLLEMWTFG